MLTFKPLEFIDYYTIYCLGYVFGSTCAQKIHIADSTQTSLGIIFRINPQSPLD